MINEIFAKIYQNSLFKNSIYLMIANLSNYILGFFFWIIAARYYAPEDIGIVSAIISSILLIATISSIGLPTAIIFYLPRNTKDVNSIIDSCLVICILASLIFSIIFIFGIDIWIPDIKQFFNNLWVIIIFIIVTIMMTISSLMSGAFVAGKRSSFQMSKEIIFHTIKIFPLFLFTEFGTMGIFLSISLGSILSIMIGFFLLFKLWKYKPRFRLDRIVKSMARFSVGNYIADIFCWGPRFILPIIVLNMMSAEYSGFFFIAITIAGVLYAVPGSISSSLLAESHNSEKFLENINRAILFNIFLLIPGLLLFVIFGKFILNIFDPAYAQNATISLIILTATSIPLSLVSIFNTVRNVQKRVTSVIKMNMLVATITIVLSVPLIKIYGIEGAAFAHLIANTVGAIVVINRIKSPTEFTLEILKGVKNIHISKL